MGGWSRWPVALAALTAVLVLAPAASAAYPGLNGKIVFRSDRAGQPDVWIANADGGNQINLTADLAAFAFGPSVSADGKRIAFYAGTKLATVNTDGSGLAVLPVDVTPYFGPVFTPDGQRIVFERDTGGNATRLMIVAADGSGAVTELNTGGAPTSQELAPAFSFDGNRLAFSSNRPGSTGIDIYLAAGNGSGSVDFSNRAGFDQPVDFAPDGNSLLWLGEAGGAPALLTAPVSPIGTAPTQIPAAPSAVTSVAFSPDGKRVAYTSPAQGGDADVLTSALDGTGLTNVSDGATSNVVGDQDPSWAPLVDAQRTITAAYVKRRFKGTLTATDPGCVAGAAIDVLQKRHRKLRRVASGETDAAGVYSIKLKGAAGKFTVKAPADARVGVANCLEATSPRLRVG